MTALWVVLTACLAAVAALGQWQVHHLRRRLRVAHSVIAHWRRMAYSAGRPAPISAGELAQRIASRPLTIEQQQMMRRYLSARRNQAGQS